MPFVTTVPEALGTAAGDLQGIGSSMTAGSAAAAAPTTGVIPPAADVVSALTAAQFASHAQLFQTVSAQAAAQQDLFATTMGTSGASMRPLRPPTAARWAEGYKGRFADER